MYLKTQVHDVNIALNEQEVLEVPPEGSSSLKDESGYKKFLKLDRKLDDLNIKELKNKSLKGEFQLLFELVNKDLLP